MAISTGTYSLLEILYMYLHNFELRTFAASAVYLRFKKLYNFEFRTLAAPASATSLASEINLTLVLI